MGCPCANPPGKGGKPIPRIPMAFKPLNPENTRLSRDDIRNKRVKRVPVVVEEDEIVEETRPVGKPYRRRPMTGFLSDAMRRR